MKFVLLLFVAASVSAVNHPNGNRASHPYEFVRSGSTRVNDLGSKAPHLQGQFSRLKPAAPNAAEKPVFKKSSGVPPYAVLMEPLVKYSQPDPLYTDGKDVNGKKAIHLKSDLKLKKEETKAEIKAEKKISSKSGITLLEDQEGEGTHFQPQQERHRLVAWTGPGIYYEGPPPTEPEPIIEIIIKESNESLPTPPPLPTTTRKKKKEQVQVFYVKYKKDPSAHYGEEKIIYDAPVPAVTPPTNNADTHEHDEEPEGYPHHSHHEEDVTLPPRPSTTLKAIIKPDSEVYHGSGGVRITFGSHHDEEGYEDNHHPHHHSYHRGDYEEQSAPQPSIIPPPKKKSALVPRANSESQLTKRNPAPFHSQTQPPQQSFGPSVSTPREFHRPTPIPTFQQTPQFPPQPFKPHAPKVVPSQPPSPASPPRPSPTRYSTLPQHLQQFSKPQPSFSFPPPRPHTPQQPIPQPTVQSQQYYSINQPHFKSSFHVRQNPPQQYQTISSQAAQQHNFPKPQPIPQNPPVPSFHQPPKPFPQPTHSFPQPTLSFPPAPNPFPQTSTFSQIPQQVLGPIIQRSPAPLIPQQNTFVSKPVFPPPQSQHHQPPPPSQPLHHQPSPQPHHQPIPQPHHQPSPQSSHQQQHQQLQQHQQHQHQVEQLNRLQQQQQRLQSQVLDQQKQNFFNQQQFQTTYAPEIIKSITPELPFANHRFEPQRTQAPIQTNRPTSRPQISHTIKSSIQYSAPKSTVTTTESFKKYTQTTQQPIEYVTEDPKKAEEERRKKEEKKKQNEAALPAEVPDDLRQQLLSSGILGNADIQILDYDKIGDIPIESLPPEALANFQAVAGSEPVPSVVKPDPRQEDIMAEASEQSSVVVAPNAPSDIMEMKVVRYNPDSKEGAQVPNQYVKEGATQLEPVVLNDSKYNRYLPLKVAGAQFPVPDVPELRGKNVTSVVVLAPVDYEFLQRHDEVIEDTRAGRRSSHPVLEVQGVHFVAGDVLKTLVKTPTSENYRKWLDRENKTSLEKQSVVLLVIEPTQNSTTAEKEIFMYDIGTQKVSKLSGELSAQFVEVAESNSENDDLEEISDSPGGDFTVKDTSEISPVHVRTQRKAVEGNSQRNKSKVSPR